MATEIIDPQFKRNYNGGKKPTFALCPQCGNHMVSMSVQYSINRRMGRTFPGVKICLRCKIIKVLEPKFEVIFRENPLDDKKSQSVKVGKT